MDEQPPISTAEAPLPRRGFFAAVGRFLSAIGLSGVARAFGISPESPPVTPDSAPTIAANDSEPVATMTSLPASVEELSRLSDEQKVMLAAVTASGCDAVAYYKPDGKGGLAAEQVIQLYPPAHYRESGGKQPEFATTIAGYNAESCNTPEQVLANTQYHIPVPLVGKDGKPTNQIQGIIVLHAPQESLSKLQDNTTEKQDDLHEPVSARLAKLAMAKHIVSAHQDLFGATGSLLQNREAAHQNISAKIAYFEQMIKDSYATMSTGNDQQAHVDGVAKFMDTAVAKTMNASDEQRRLIHDLAVLHDVGKSQMSSAFMKPWRKVKTKEANDYFIEQNHNHPLFTLLELLMYPTEAKMTAAHHHGLFRYDSEELKHALGENFDQYTILKDNLRPDQLSPLAYMMRICDVAESMTDRAKKPFAKAVGELADMVKLEDGKPLITPRSIHPDYLCLMIKNGVFDALAPENEREALRAVEQQVLAKFGWNDEKEKSLRTTIANDPMLLENAPSPLKQQTIA